MKKPLVLCILDGVGIAPADKYNALSQARMPFYNSLFKDYPNTELDAAGTAVGLTPGTMGNSEIGHLMMGAGRVVNQFVQRFELAKPDMDKNPALLKFISDMKSSGGTVHMLGLSQDAMVHSNIHHAIFIAKILQAAGLPIVWHFIADGRDSPPKSAQKFINLLRTELGDITFGTLSGRYYTMDRNNNLDRTATAFDAIAYGKSEFDAPDIETALAAAYARGETDEFIRPVVIGDYDGIKPNDGLLFFNYRSDRARQILKMLTGNGQRTTDNVLCFSQYGEGLDEICPALLPDEKIENTLGDVLAAGGLSQLRIAETEKYNHVTYFFDAERTMDYPHETKILIPSADVPTFDTAPEMKANEITDALLDQLHHDVIVVNFANGDMIGHTGNMAAAQSAMETVDKCLARIVPAVLDLGGTVLITSDHGNIEYMWDTAARAPRTAHTINKVPFIIISPDAYRLTLNGKTAGLADIAPTMLKILGIEKPAEMTGESLV
jgi:2,3-bisphosphoglycerate-independent phosphoglycerate mutase